MAVQTTTVFLGASRLISMNPLVEMILISFDDNFYQKLTENIKKWVVFRWLDHRNRIGELAARETVMDCTAKVGTEGEEVGGFAAMPRGD